MRIPPTRLNDFKNAYDLSTAEQVELDKLYTFEQLVESTGEDKEFGEAVLSVVDPENATSIYVIGGRSMSLTSPILQAKAAEFLKRPDNRLVFIYPKSNGFTQASDSLWFHNTHQDMMQIQKAVQEFSDRPVADQIQFYGIDVRSAGGDPLLIQALSLCGPFTAMTITGPRAAHQNAGYVYIEAPRDRWVLLRVEHAKRALHTITLLLERAVEGKGVTKETFS